MLIEDGQEVLYKQDPIPTTLNIILPSISSLLKVSKK